MGLENTLHADEVTGLLPAVALPHLGKVAKADHLRDKNLNRRFRASPSSSIQNSRENSISVRGLTDADQFPHRVRVGLPPGKRNTRASPRNAGRTEIIDRDDRLIIS